MPSDRHKIVPACFLILKKENKILLLKRFNTGYMDGQYTLVSGHLDGDESFRQAMIREAKEEAGITLEPEHLEVVHVMHRNEPNNSPAIRDRVDIFVSAKKWSGEPHNTEPNKCDDMAWFDIKNLPENVIPYVRQVLELTEKNIFYSEFGWS